MKGSLGGGDLTVYAVYPDKNYEYDYFGSPATSFSVMQRWDWARAQCLQLRRRCERQRARSAAAT